MKAKDGDRRKDWAQKTSTDLARRFDVIRLENLNIKAMTRSAGDRGEPGQKRRTESRAQPGHPQIRLGSARRLLEQKAPGRVEEVKAAYTSQT